jgi:hypothetical protein
MGKRGREREREREREKKKRLGMGFTRNVSDKKEKIWYTYRLRRKRDYEKVK